MSIRALWVVTHDKGESVKVQFSRRYPSVEFRAKTFAGVHYVCVPEDCDIAHLILSELGLADPDKPFVAARDDCSRQQRSPALELRFGSSGKRTLWPVLTIVQGGLILACLPLIEASPDPRPSLPSLASVSQGLALLSSLQGFLCGTGSKPPDSDVLVSRLATLPSVLMQVCPLGTPLDQFPQSGTLPAALVSGSGGAQKQPAWKTGVHRGRAVVTVALTEMVTSMQYGNQSKQDLWDVHGTVTCKCEVEGVLPNVTVTLALPQNGSPLQDILVHPCVTSIDSSILTASSVEENDGSAFSGPYKFPFSPPLEPFRLCSYTSQVPVPPILGSYHLKSEESHLRLNLVLKLHESIRNSFEYCDAHLPFFNRNLMGNVDIKVTSGQLDVSKEKNMIVWFIGQKFPKSREVALEGTVHFSGHLAGPSDPLCADLTAFTSGYLIRLYLDAVWTSTLYKCTPQQSHASSQHENWYLLNTTSGMPLEMPLYLLGLGYCSNMTHYSTETVEDVSPFTLYGSKFVDTLPAN